MINGVDSGFRVDLGVYSAPKQPRSPYPPRYFREARTVARLRNTALAGITGQGDMDEAAGRDTRGRDGDTCRRPTTTARPPTGRSEERRVGKECRSRGWR